MSHNTAMPALERSVGLITAEPTPSLLAILVHAGVDFLVLDAEQTGLTVQQCRDVVQRLAGSGVQVAVRVPDLEANTLVAFANTGVGEIVLPQVCSINELERAHDATRYAPEGSRPKQVSQASAFGADYSRPPRITVLFETVDAVERVEDFAASPFFSGGWVGPTDLASDLRRRGDGGPEAVENAVRTVVGVLSRAGHSVGLPAAGMEGAGDVFASGADRCAVYWERELASLLSGYAASRLG
ncbi:aldolase/citrate lyase family protein [Arthrobacter sp. I2-34]|uniref:Aldolase/citrate lyase family protein n=1 Tax=Arthrobacter hankyongi TaxID=2904801 RepID=A0ABS9L7F0_9MICC|nr:aldolase/citrate lyase family protein [Arthrobacter hankyongi]MCG2622551.1 aldolase/citrate lyase family protein [Arthrobacter hankyongi]